MRPPNMPSAPNTVYRDHGWQGWGHWLGTSNCNLVTKQFLPFDEALAVARSLNLANAREWTAWSKEGLRPRNVPSAPNKVYEDHGWQGWGHWLGTGNIQNGDQQFLPFDEALAMARSFGLAGMSGSKEWRAWCKEGMRPRNMPADPNRVYKDHGWQGWGHWLGTGSQRPRATQFLEFGEALRVARSLRLNTSSEWKAWCRSGARPANVPANPDQFYVHDGWLGWEQWLHHANLDGAAAPAPAVPRPTSKRAAAGCAGTASGKGRGKRRRR